MYFPFKIIESKIADRKQFELGDGHQPTHALFYLKEGSFVVEIDGTKEEIHAGDCVILPDYIHFRRSVVNHIVFVYIKFAYNTNCPFSLELPYGKVEFKDRNRFFASISALERLIDSDDPLSASYREHLLIDILFQIYFEQNSIGMPFEKRSYHNALVVSAIAYIEENISKKIMIEDICRAVGTNASSLNFKFRREVDMSIGQFIINERMKKARHLLISTTYSLSEIALRCGFENVYYFSNAFKKINGISPSAYRK